MKNIFVPMRDATGHAFNNGRPSSDGMRYIGSMRIENAETRTTEMCDIWCEGELSASNGMTISLIGERSTTGYNVRSSMGTEDTFTISYAVLGSNHFSGNMYEEIEELRRMLQQVKILI